MTMFYTYTDVELRMDRELLADMDMDIFISAESQLATTTEEDQS